ncbi:MAG: ribonuclease D, partial [Proteobacteria bacterium]|nr:ribonuclease D [Pseudomonadota bacterium]
MMNQTQPQYILVEKYPDLCRIGAALQKEEAIGVDLEADSMFHYQERVCLLQISTRTQNILVDPLAVKDVSPLTPVFADSRVRKVFHGADYDIRSLYRDFGIEVHSLFDTEIAARFLGFRESGLASLLRHMFGLIIEKKYQKRDWSQRPLPPPMCVYAAQDSCHLLTLSRLFEKKLRTKGLLFCVEEECEALSKVRPAPREDSPLFLKFKGAGKLDSRSLAVLEALLQFRDDVARRRDLPPFKIVGNLPLLEMAQKKPVTPNKLIALRGLSPKQVKSLGQPLLERIREALNLPEEALPTYPRKPRPAYDHKVTRRVKALREWREHRASSLGIDSALTLSNAQIRALALENPDHPHALEQMTEIKNWQKHLFGPEICALLK